MKTWNNMTEDEKKQHKYEVRKARKAFEARAKLPYERVISKHFKPNQTTVSNSSYMGRIDTLKPHGAREMNRRKRQIELGQLKAENGLVP